MSLKTHVPVYSEKYPASHVTSDMIKIFSNIVILNIVIFSKYTVDLTMFTVSRKLQIVTDISIELDSHVVTYIPTSFHKCQINERDYYEIETRSELNTFEMYTNI